jgi:hypothetical protein
MLLASFLRSGKILSSFMKTQSPKNPRIMLIFKGYVITRNISKAHLSHLSVFVQS